MKWFIFAALLSIPMLVNASASPLGEFKWKKRVLVLLAPAGDALLARQKAKLTSVEAAMEDRDLQVVEESDPSGPLHRYFKPDAPFSAFLIGKDGGTKWRSTAVFDPQVILDKVDSMPMRADEKKEKESL